MDSHEFDAAHETLREMHRNRAERKLAGVCAALADRMELPLPLVRAGFLIGVFIPGVNTLVILLYLALWFVTPPALGERSALDRLIDAVRDLLGVNETAARRESAVVSSDELPSDPSA